MTSAETILDLSSPRIRQTEPATFVVDINISSLAENKCNSHKTKLYFKIGSDTFSNHSTCKMNLMREELNFEHLLIKY